MVLIEWPADELEPTQYCLSTLPATISRRALVAVIKLRWRIKRDCQDLKQELGLGQYEGEAGAAFIITPRCAPLLTDSCSSKREHCPPQDNANPSYREYPYPKVIDLADPPTRPGRHMTTTHQTDL